MEEKEKEHTPSSEAHTSTSSNLDISINNDIKTDRVSDKISDSQKAKETTRTFIAQLYVWGFFSVIAIVFVIGIINGFDVDSYKDMLVTVSGILSGPLGFIVGYYFKASTE